MLKIARLYDDGDFEIIKAERNEGMKEGFQKGRLEMLFDLVRDNLLTIKDAASQAKLAEEAFRKKMMESGR